MLLVGVKIPPGLVVEADGVSTIYKGRTTGELDGEAEPDPFRELLDPSDLLRMLAPATSYSEGQEHLVPGFELTELVLKRDRLFPGLCLFDLVAEFELLVFDLSFQFHLKYLPPNLVRLRLETHYFRGMKLALIEPAPRSNWDLSHLSLLQTLEILRVNGVRLGMVLFPSSLLRIQCLNCTHLDIDEVEFPPRLEILELSRCWLPNPWSYRLDPEVLVVYPESLKVLVLKNNRTLVPPPPSFALPQGLVELGMSHCGISDLTQFQLPSSLRRLDVSHNEFPFPENYQWPQLQTLTIDLIIQPREQTKLEREHPGLHIVEV